jgi:hypothetical protein
MITNLTRGTSRRIAVASLLLVFLGAVALTAMVAESGPVRSQTYAISGHAAYVSAVASEQEVLASCVCATSVTSGDEHWYDDAVPSTGERRA